MQHVAKHPERGGVVLLPEGFEDAYRDAGCLVREAPGLPAVEIPTPLPGFDLSPDASGEVGRPVASEGAPGDLEQLLTKDDLLEIQRSATVPSTQLIAPDFMVSQQTPTRRCSSCRSAYQVSPHGDNGLCQPCGRP